MLPGNLFKWTKVLVDKYQLHPGRRLGQHFLIDKSVIETMVQAAKLKPGQKVLEVGGGLGTLTLYLLDQGVRLTVVELDKKLKTILDGYKTTSAQFQVVEADILTLSDQDIKESLALSVDESWFLLANLPYEISGAFFRKFLSGALKPDKMIVLVQREVAERLVAKPGQLSLLGLQAQLNAEIKILKKIKPAAFFPPPKVESALVILDIYSSEKKARLLQGLSEDFFWQIVRLGFGTKRKQLQGSLSRGFSLDKLKITQVFSFLGLKSSVRPQELSLNDWVSLGKELKKVVQFTRTE